MPETENLTPDGVGEPTPPEPATPPPAAAAPEIQAPEPTAVVAAATTTEELATDEAAPPDPDAAPEGETAAAPVVEPSKKRWYVVKVQSGREESIKEAIERRVKIEGLEEFFGQIVIPIE